ncbi:MAG: hypothetical protein E6G46_00425 [Actinobacteria bacterium]|nr:MAG: hypothetical protein E6G46_00425 [Actinomycetota bacterium]
MSDDVTYQPGFEQPQSSDERLRETVGELAELVRDAARRTAALDARIDSLPGPMEIASAVESEVERSVREARDVIDARVGSLGGELESLSRRLAEVSEALVPLEGLRTEIATVADESAAFRDIRATLQTALEQLADGRVPTLDTSGPERVGAEVDARLDNFRRLLDETTAQIRSDFEVLVRGEQEASERRSDALGLRITNMSVGVTSTLEYLTQQAERIAERGRAIESENAGILQAIREQVEAIRSAAPRTASDDGVLLEALRGVEGRVRDIESRLSERMSSLESRVDRKPGDAGLDEVREQLNSLVAVWEAPARDPMLQQIHDKLSSLSIPEASRDPILDEIRAQLERIASAAPQPADRNLNELRAQLAELASSPAQPADGLLNEIRSELYELRGELLELREREGPPRDPILDEIRANLDRLSSAEPAETDPILHEIRAHLERLSTAEKSAPDPILQDIRGQLDKMSSVEPAETDPILHEIRAQLSDLIAVEGPPRDPILDDIRAEIAALRRPEDETQTAASTETAIASAVEHLRAALDEAVGTVQDGVARSVGELSMRLDAVEAKIVQVAGDTSDALDGAAAQTAGGMQDLRAALTQLSETGSGIERIRQELFQAMESFSTQLVTRTAAVRTSISERTGRLEEKIAAIANPDDLVAGIVERLTPSIADASRERDEKIAGIEQELGGVASNVNEIWIRVRAIVKRIEEERSSAHDESTRTAEQIEELTAGEERLGVRVMEAEQRLIHAMRAIETARDRVFLETLNDLLERMPRRERKLFRRRVREIGSTRGEPVAPSQPAAAPAPPPQRRFAPLPSDQEPRGSRASEPPPAKPKPKPKPKAKSKPKPRPKPAVTAPAAAQAAPAAQARPKPKPKAKPKPAAPAAKAAPKAAPRAPKPPSQDAAPTPAAPEPPKPESEARAVVDTHARDEATETSPQRAKGPSKGATGDSAAEGQTGTEKGA